MKEVITTFVQPIAQTSRQGSLNGNFATNRVASFVQHASFTMRLIEQIKYMRSSYFSILRTN